MGSYLHMIKIKLLMSFNYRSEFFIGLFSKFILLLATTFFWKAAYHGLPSVAGVTEEQMLTYNVISNILGAFFAVNVENNIRSRVRMGDVAVDLIKPINIFAMYFAEDVGNMVSNIVGTVIPVVAFSLLFISAPFPVSGVAFPIFLMSMILSFVLIWLISALFGLFYFWFIDMGPIGAIKHYLILILSGAFIPIWFFPDWLQTILKFLPFIYIYQQPIGVYIGRISIADGAMGLLIQIVWIAIFAGFFLLLKRKMEKNILVQGG